MAFELVGKYRAKLVEVNVQSLKLGQTELKPAISLRFKVTLPNTALNMLSLTLREFLYERGSSGAAMQGTLEGVAPVTDMPALTPAAVKLGSFGWKDEQSACKLIVYRGVTGDHDIRLRDGTRTIQKIDPKEGGTVDVTFDYDATDLDAETMGDLAVLKNHEPDIELIAPEILQRQPDLNEDEGEEDPLTPEKAMAGALQQQHEGKEVTVKPPKGKTPASKGKRGTVVTPIQALKKANKTAANAAGKKRA